MEILNQDMEIVTILKGKAYIYISKILFYRAKILGIKMEYPAVIY